MRNREDFPEQVIIGDYWKVTLDLTREIRFYFKIRFLFPDKHV